MELLGQRGKPSGRFWTLTSVFLEGCTRSLPRRVKPTVPLAALPELSLKLLGTFRMQVLCSCYFDLHFFISVWNNSTGTRGNECLWLPVLLHSINFHL